MLLKALAAVTWIFSANIPAHGAQLEPMYRAADANGYEVVGEFAFRPGSALPPAAQVRANLDTARELCPQAAQKGPPENHVHFVILAWSDNELPNADARGDIPSLQRRLADTRAHAVADLLRHGLRGPRLSFDLINMASPHPQHIREGSRAQMSPHQANLKAVLQEAGAAPTDAWSAGLFGEYSQKSKAIVWMDCIEPTKGRPFRAAANTYQLAQLWVNFGTMGQL